MQYKPMIPDKPIEHIELDIENGEAIVVWSDGTSEPALIVECDFGPHGTWMKIVLGRQPDKTLCISQSGTMEPSCYFENEPPIVANEIALLAAEIGLADEFADELTEPTEVI